MRCEEGVGWGLLLFHRKGLTKNKMSVSVFMTRYVSEECFPANVMDSVLDSRRTLRRGPRLVIHPVLTAVVPQVTRKRLLLSHSFHYHPVLSPHPPYGTKDRRHTSTQTNTHKTALLTLIIVSVPAQPALEGVEVRCDPVLRPLLVTFCQ